MAPFVYIQTSMKTGKTEQRGETTKGTKAVVRVRPLGGGEVAVSVGFETIVLSGRDVYAVGQALVKLSMGYATEEEV